jgi:hypothetical protein
MTKEGTGIPIFSKRNNNLSFLTGTLRGAFNSFPIWY